MCISEGHVENPEKDGRQLRTEGVVDLIRNAIVSRCCPPVRCFDDRLELGGVKTTIIVDALSQSCIVRGERGREGVQEHCLSILINIGSRAEQADGRIRAVKMAGIGERGSHADKRREVRRLSICMGVTGVAKR